MAKLSTPKDLERWIAYLQAQGLPIDVRCEKWKEPRKLTANAFLWAFCYSPLVEVAGFDAEAWHEWMCCQYFGSVAYTKIDGSDDIRPKRTTTKNEHGQKDVLKGDAFNDFLMFVESECAKRGVFIERGAL